MSDHRYPTRQAVVFIHGIGEQRPMQTLRSFVNGIVTVTNDYGQKFWSKPDRMSDSFELRRLTAPGDRDHWPTTDYFEYYWAFHMRDTKYRHVVAWLLRLLFTRPWRIPRRIRWVWWGSWVLVALAVVSALAGWLPLPGQTQEAGWAGWAVSITSLAVACLLNTVFLGFIGDAARYLSPNPDNIAQRQAIRRDGVRLIRQLHASGKYGRIIIVGHSLGSVIAYDIVRFVWDEFRDTSPDAHSAERRACIEEMRELIDEGPVRSMEHVFAERYQELQKRLWRAERERGAAWLVTDLVTCGSPLAHASLLLATSQEDLDLRQRERELPTCPPRSQKREDSFTYPCPTDDECDRDRPHVPILHSSAPFACVRWSNLYYKSDFIGGPLAGVFGPGIRDIRIEKEKKDSTKKRYCNWLYLKGFIPTSHGMYWMQPRSRPNHDERPPKMWNAVRRMRGAMRVNDYALVTFEPLMAGDQAGAED